jgi:hypothetical protein
MVKSRFAAVAALALFAAAGPAAAQIDLAPKPGAAKGADSLSDPVKSALQAEARKAAFLAMPEADRKAVQDALVWLGFYNGVVDGAFGKRTLESILAYQAGAGAPSSGVVSPAQLAALEAAADKARLAVGFQTFDDPATGIRIGAPLKLLDRRASAGAKTRLTARDGSMSLDLVARPAAEGEDLAALYAKMSAETPDRKIEYKAMKAGAFFVVTGADTKRKFYLRYAAAPPGAPEPGAIRGFTFSYPAAKAADLDRVALAITNAFEPFPAKVKPGAPVVEEVKSPPPSEPVLTATALIVAPGEAVTALAEADCKTPMVQGKPVKFLRADSATGLSRLAGEFTGAAAAPRLADARSGLVVLSLAPGGTGKPVLEAADATLAAPSFVIAALAKSARGAPVFDRAGALVGLIAATGAEPRRLGGVILAAPHRLIGALSAAEWLPAPAGAAADLPPLGASDIARQMRASIAGIYCAP